MTGAEVADTIDLHLLEAFKLMGAPNKIAKNIQVHIRKIDNIGMAKSVAASAFFTNNPH